MPPQEKEAKRLDLFRQKVYSMGSLQLRISNQQVLLGRYDFNLSDSLSKFNDSLPQESRQTFTAILETDGQECGQDLPQAALDVADSAARSTASLVTMRHCL